MKPSFWIRKFALVFLSVFVVLVLAGFARGRPWSGSMVLADSALWSAASSSLFVATRLFHSSRGRRCALCGDSPETATNRIGQPQRDVHCALT